MRDKRVFSSLFAQTLTPVAGMHTALSVLVILQEVKYFPQLWARLKVSRPDTVIARTACWATRCSGIPPEGLCLWAMLVVSGPDCSDSLLGDVPVHHQLVYMSVGHACSFRSGLFGQPAG